MGEEIITPIVVGEEGEIGEPLPVACDYAAPPMGCNYVAGPSYNAMTNCGKILSCMDMGHEPYTITLLAGSG